MRIGDYKNTDLKAPKKELLSSVTGNKKNEFSRNLEIQENRERINDLSKLMERIHETGKSLAISRNLSDLKRYKNAVADFLKEANSRTYSLKEDTSWDYMGNRKRYVLVEKIDAKMEELTEEVKSSQEENLRILEIIDEIKGLLVDEYM